MTDSIRNTRSTADQNQQPQGKAAGALSASNPTADGAAYTDMATQLKRRDLGLRVLRGLIIWITAWSGTLLLVAVISDWWREPLQVVSLIGLGVVLAMMAAWIAFRDRPATRQLLWFADRQVAGQEQLVTAFELSTDDPQHPLLPALRSRCEPLLPRVNLRRVLPFGFGRMEAGSSVFLLVATALFFILPSLGKGITPAAIPDNGVLATQGQRLEELAQEWTAISAREQYPRLASFAQQVSATAKLFQSDEPPLEQAIQMLLNLAENAATLATKVPPTDDSSSASEGALVERTPGEMGEISEAEGSEFVALGTEGAHSANAGLATVPELAEVVESDRRGRGSARTPRTEDMNASANTFDMAPSNRMRGEAQLLRLAEEDLEFSARQLSQRIETADGTPAPADLPESGTDTSSTANDLGETNGSRPATQQGTTSDTTLAGDAGRFGEMDETATAVTSIPRPKQAPTETGYVDYRVSGLNTADEGGSDTIWVQRDPQAETRRTRLAPFDQQLRRATLTAEGRGGIPREYWAVLKAYQANLQAAAERAGTLAASTNGNNEEASGPSPTPALTGTTAR